MVGFIFGGNTNETPESLKRKREIIEAMITGQRTPQNWGEGWGAVMKGIATGIEKRRLNKAEQAGQAGASSVYNDIIGKITGGMPLSGASDSGSGGNIPMSDAGAEAAQTSPGGSTPDMTGNDVYTGFMDTVKAGGVGNPYALAAIAATGNAESRFSPGNVNRTWSDPSERGQAGTADGVMSWRGPRLASLQAYAASKGEQGNGSPQTQAEFLLQEDPNLMAAMNSAGSVEEAQSLMNNAWKFAGYNRPGGEAARRLSTARGYLPAFQGSGGDVAAATPEAAFSAAMPEIGGSPSLSDEVSEFRQTPEFMQAYPGGYTQQPLTDQQFNDRWGGPNAMQLAQDMQGMQSALAGQQQSAGQQAIDMQAIGIPQQFQGSQQLTGAQGGVMPMLSGGQPATAQEVAQAQTRGQQPVQDMGSGISLEELYKAAANPWVMGDPAMGRVIKMLLEQEMQKRDPSRQLDMRYRQAQIDKMSREAENPGVSGIFNPRDKIANDSIEGALARVRSMITDGRSNLTDFNAVFRAKLDIDDMIERAVGQGAGNRAHYLQQVQRQINDALAGASSSYSAARDTFAKASREIDAVGRGGAAARLASRADDNIPAFGAMTPEEQLAFRVGYADPLIGRVESMSMSPTTNKARPFQTPKYEAEFKAFAAPGKADQLGRRIGREQRMFDTAQAALGGSKRRDCSCPALRIAP